MPISVIPINKGVYKTRYDRQLENVEFAEELVNIHIDEYGANHGRPSLEEIAELASVDPLGGFHFQGYFLFVTLDRRIFTVDSNGTVSDVTGVTLPGDGRAVFTDDGETVFIIGGGTPITWQPLGVTADLAGGPPEGTHIAYFDGYLFINETDVVMRFSELQDAETWSSDNFFSAVAGPDPIRAHYIAGREIYVVGENTTEVWQNVGAEGVPFVRAFVWEYGSTAVYGSVVADNSLFIVDRARRIIRFSGRQVIRVSEGIEVHLAEYDTIDDCIGSTFMWQGRIFCLFLFPSAGKAWCLDVASGNWHEWRGYDDNGWARVRLSCVVPASDDSGLVFAGDFNTGRIWRFSDTSRTDAGGIFKFLRTFASRDVGASVRKRASLVRVKMKRNVATEFTGTTSETNPQIELRWQDSNGPWSDFRMADLGEVGETKDYVEFRRLGIYRSRKYQIQMSDPVEFRIVKVETDEEAMNA